MNARIQHVSIPLPPDREDEARTFYGDLLGLEGMPVPAALSELDLLWYRLGDTEIHLYQEQLAPDRSARHFCIAVDDVEGLRRRMEEAGVPVVGATPIPGRPRYFCRDPFGNLVELTTIVGDSYSA